VHVRRAACCKLHEPRWALRRHTSDVALNACSQAKPCSCSCRPGSAGPLAACLIVIKVTGVKYWAYCAWCPTPWHATARAASGSAKQLTAAAGQRQLQQVGGQAECGHSSRHMGGVQQGVQRMPLSVVAAHQAHLTRSACLFVVSEAPQSNLKGHAANVSAVWPPIQYLAVCSSNGPSMYGSRKSQSGVFWCLRIGSKCVLLGTVLFLVANECPVAPPVLRS
jgi:hypothetical protein